MTLTNTDKNWIKDLLDDQEQKFEAKIVGVKSDFLDKIDPILKEVVASREDRTIGAEQHRRNQDRIEKLESIHPQGKHSPATA